MLIIAQIYCQEFVGNYPLNIFFFLEKRNALDYMLQER